MTATLKHIAEKALAARLLGPRYGYRAQLPQGIRRLSQVGHAITVAGGWDKFAEGYRAAIVAAIDKKVG